MGQAASGEVQPTRGRMTFAALMVIVVVLAVWKLIDYRTQPPPPPNPIGASADHR